MRELCFIGAPGVRGGPESRPVDAAPWTHMPGVLEDIKERTRAWAERDRLRASVDKAVEEFAPQFRESGILVSDVEMHDAIMRLVQP